MIGLGLQHGRRFIVLGHQYKLDEESSFNSITPGFLVRKLGRQQIVPSFMCLDYE